MNMLEIILLISNTLLLIFPAYVSNSAAIIFGGKKPIDFGKHWFDGKRIFGNGKTISGSVFGTLAGLLIAIVLNFLNPTKPMSEATIIGLLLCSGAIFGDIIGSFIKRRTNIKSGDPIVLLDQLDFVLGAIMFTIYLPLLGFAPLWTITNVAVVLIITPPIHILTNILAFKLKLKKVPW